MIFMHILLLKIVAERQELQPSKNGTSKSTSKIGTSGISNISTTQQQIPKEHKFVVSNIASQHVAIFSHTSGHSAGPTDPLPPTPDKLCLEVNEGHNIETLVVVRYFLNPDKMLVLGSIPRFDYIG